MAPVMPTLGVVSRVTDVLATVRTWEGAPVVDVFRRLLQALPGDEQRSQMPAALGEALMPLRLEPERARLAMDVAIDFDLYEASSGVARLVRTAPTSDVLVRAAILANHPGASDELRDVVALASSGVAQRDDVVARQFEIAQHPQFTPKSASDRLALVSVWPGRSETGVGDPPVVAITEDVGSVGQRFDLMLEARSAGARVRRLPLLVDRTPSKEWIPRSTVVIASPSADEAWWSPLVEATGVLAADGIGPSARLALLRRVNDRLPRDRRLRLAAEEQTQLPEDPFEEIDAFLAGAFRTHEMAYLAGMSRQTVAKTCREFDELHPRDYRGVHYWGFPTLVGLRAWNYARKRTRRRLGPALAAEFVRLSHAERAVPVAITIDGKVLMEVEDGSYSDAKGQLTSDVFFVAGAIRERFVLGGHRSVPDLLMPSPYTAVNPDVQGGSPTVKGSRVKVEVLERAARRAIEDGMAGPAVADYVLRRFPELNEQQLEDARRTARDLEAVR